MDENGDIIGFYEVSPNARWRVRLELIQISGNLSASPGLPNPVFANNTACYIGCAVSGHEELGFDETHQNGHVPVVLRGPVDPGKFVTQTNTGGNTISKQATGKLWINSQDNVTVSPNLYEWLSFADTNDIMYVREKNRPWEVGYYLINSKTIVAGHGDLMLLT